MVSVLCIALIELLVLDAYLVMGGVERDPFCCNLISIFHSGWGPEGLKRLV